MRRAISRPLIYLVAFAGLLVIVSVDPEMMLARGPLILMTLPWSEVMYYLVGVFGVDLPVFIDDRQGAVLGIAGALVQAALLSYLGSRADRKPGMRPVSRRFVTTAVGIAAAPLVLYGAAYKWAVYQNSRPRPPVVDVEKVAADHRRLALTTLRSLTRAEYAWFQSHRGQGYTLDMRDVISAGEPGLKAALDSLDKAKFRVRLTGRIGVTKRVMTFAFDIEPPSKEPHRTWFHADLSGVPRESTTGPATSTSPIANGYD